VGNFIEQKNHAFLLDWFKLLAEKNQNVLLLLISDGALMDAMKEKAHMLGLDDQVLFLGKTTEMPGYMQAMDLFVLPSLHEGLPVVLVEAQAAGLRCYVADTVTRETDLTDSIRFLPITDGEVWADTIQDHLASAQNRTEDCENWQRAISEAGYDVTRNADRMRKLYLSYYQ
jgi:glycosyltransferase involved in cell wall biosynthesis